MIQFVNANMLDVHFLFFFFLHASTHKNGTCVKKIWHIMLLHDYVVDEVFGSWVHLGVLKTLFTKLTFGNLLSFLLRCGTRPYEMGTQ